MFFSSNIFAAAGEGVPLAKPFSFDLISFIGVSFSVSFSTTSLTIFFSFDFGAFAEVSIKQITDPTSTASPSFAFKVITPLCSAGRSKVALSESTSAMV